MSGERAIAVAFGRESAASYDEHDAAWEWFRMAMPDLHRKLIASELRDIQSVHSEALARLASGNTAGV